MDPTRGAQEEENPHSSHHDSDEDSSATLKNPDVGMKWKLDDLMENGRKKQKVIKDSNPIGLTDEDYNLLVDRMVEVVDETHQNINSRHTDIFDAVTELLQTLCYDVK